MLKPEDYNGKKDDVWIPSACRICYSHCAIRVHRVDGVVVKIEGNPDAPSNKGRICSRGLSGIMQLYDPSRVNVPLKRTNPKKGIGIDPGWVEITWDEALSTIAERLKKTRAEDPRKLICLASVAVWDAMHMNLCFTTAFGSSNYCFTGAGTHCGNAEHLMSGTLHGSFISQPDPDYCKYLLNFGVPVGCGAHYANNAMVQRMADARVGGMRHVVIDPWMGMAAEKADEWIPIRPGTDAAMALAMLNVILNDLGIYDVEHLKHHSNGPYLIGADGHYLRHPATKKPLVWDAVAGQAKEFDDESVKDFALEGTYQINGAEGRPAFALLKEHVRRYTPEMAAEITTVPAATIRRIAKEFAEAARVGSTIVIDGKTLPYRPVAVAYFKGSQGHRHATLTSMAFELLGQVVGASNVPGASLGANSRAFGFPASGKPAYEPFADPDGLIAPGAWVTVQPPLPLRASQKPESVHFQDLVSTTCVCSPLITFGMLEPEKYGIPYKVDVAIQTGSNYLVTLGDPKVLERAFKDVFVVNFNIFLDESSDMADIVLPDASYLERHDIYVESMHSIIPTGSWHSTVAQPIVKPMYQRRPAQEVLLELAERVGMRADMYAVMNVFYGLRAPYLLNPDEKYTWEQIIDRRYKSLFGPEHGLEWFKENGVLSWPKKVEEVYWAPFLKVRAPIYFEFFKTAAEDIERVKKECGIKEFETSDFQPLPDWKPCASHQERRQEFDLYCLYYRVPFHTFTSTYNNPWLDEVSRIDPYVYNITMNAATARRKGIKDGDWIDLESAGTGNRVKGRVKVSEAIHPEVVAVGSGGGHWSRGLPIASQPEKGACFEWLLPLTFDYVDTVSFNQDLCVKVKASKSTGASVQPPGHQVSDLIPEL